MTKETVLIVEDDALVGEMIQTLLDHLGYRVIGQAKSGREAIAMTQTLGPDVILMDIKMSQMDGIEATRRIQKICPTPVVILTAYDRLDLVTQATAAGVGAYLLKPPQLQDLERAIIIATARFNEQQALRDELAHYRTALAELLRAWEEQIEPGLYAVANDLQAQASTPDSSSRLRQIIDQTQQLKSGLASLLPDG